MKKLFSFAVFLFLFVLLQISPSLGQNQEPKELTEARNSYNAELQKAIKPVNDRYLPKLEELKKQLTFKGDIKGAVAVEDVITKMSSGQALEQQGDKDPQELKEIKKNYVVELATAIKPVKSLYLAKLEVLKQQLALSGALKAALTVEEEMEKLKTVQGNSPQTYEYVGCFRDQGNSTGTSGRDISGFITNSPNMTNDMCISVCKDRGFKYAGTQYASFCFCGDKYGRSGPTNNCNMPCAGNSNQICGGAWANSVYRIR